MFRTWGGNNMKVSQCLWDTSKISEHFQLHTTLEKKLETNVHDMTLKALNMDMIRCTAVRQVPQIFWESQEFENLVKNIVKLTSEVSDPLARIKKITPRKTRARETSKLNDEIEKVNFYQ